MSFNSSRGLAGALLCTALLGTILVFGMRFTGITVRQTMPPTYQYTENAEMVDWYHIPAEGGRIHITVLRTNYETEAEFIQAVRSRLAEFPPEDPE